MVIYLITEDFGVVDGGSGLVAVVCPLIPMVQQDRRR